MHEPTPVSIEHAQQNDDQKQDIDGVNCHVLILATDLTDLFADLFTDLCDIQTFAVQNLQLQ
jgi:hypothetical protein